MTAEFHPGLIETFFRLERRPIVHFYTSNISKYLQARLVFERCGLVLTHFRTRTEPYSEDYSVGKEELLRRAVEEVRANVGSASLFFVEDTSIRVEALSTGSDDYPGLAAKEWFAASTFPTIDKALIERGNNRVAIVKSDIALHIPGMNRPVFFYGETKGTIADTEPRFAASIAHPWLTPETFNGWLIPNDSAKRLGEMSFEESIHYDFRVKSLVRLILRLEEYAAALNLPVAAYSRRSAPRSSGQLSLLSFKREILIVVGRTCAGKTTACERLSTQHGYRVFEASAILRTFPRPTELRGATEQDFAEHVLAHFGADAVARKLIDLLANLEFDKLAVSGFRTIEELECIWDHFPEARVVFIDASDRSRFERRIRRARANESLTFATFNKLDQEQWRFGLLRVAEEIADIRLMNEDSVGEFHARVDAIATSTAKIDMPGVAYAVQHQSSENSQVFRSLEVLETAGRPLDCGEISGAVFRAGTSIRPNNINKVLKRVPELATRIEMPGIRVRYNITDIGRAYLRLWRRREKMALKQ
jgi:inosine/xanthosine triphosphate pyrophosphatase family protein/dephospho-CoA kinase